MADIKTVTLNGSEVCVKIPGGNCCIRNLGSSVVFASVRKGIKPDADGVLGIPALMSDMLCDTCGEFYLKGSGKVQIVGTDYADICLGNFAASGGSSGGSGSGSEGSGGDVTTGEIDDLFGGDNVTNEDIDNIFSGGGSDGSDIPESGSDVNKSDIDDMFN